MIGTIERAWWPGLAALVAICYGIIGLEVGTAVGVAGILGAALIAASPCLRSRSRPLAGVLLCVGAVPFALLTWWSLITPLLAVLALVCGGVAIVGTETGARHPRAAAIAL